MNFRVASVFNSVHCADSAISRIPQLQRRSGVTARARV